MSFNSLLTDTCYVLRPEYTQSASGAATAAYQPIGLCMARKWGTGRQKRQSGGGQAEVTTDMCDLPATADIKAKDRLRFGSDDYDVLGINPVKSAGSLHHIEAQIQLVIR